MDASFAPVSSILLSSATPVGQSNCIHHLRNNEVDADYSEREQLQDACSSISESSLRNTENHDDDADDDEVRNSPDSLFIAFIIMVQHKLKVSRKRKNWFLLLLSMCSVIVLTAIQLRAQLLLTRQILEQELYTHDSWVERRIQEQQQQQQQRGESHVINKKLRYLALTHFPSHARSQQRHDTSSSQKSLSYSEHLAQFIKADLVHRVVPTTSVAAACLQTIVDERGDDDFHVVSVEYLVWDTSLEVLTQRIRQRYPAAMILLIELWNPTQLRYHDENGSYNTSIHWDTWSAGRDLPKLLRDPEVARLWHLPRTTASQSAVLNMTTTKLAHWANVQLISFKTRAVLENAVQRLHWFNTDHSLSVTGHDALWHVIHNAIPELLSSLSSPLLLRSNHSTSHSWLLNTGDNSNSFSNPGSWGSGDACRWWNTDLYRNAITPTKGAAGAATPLTANSGALEFRPLTAPSQPGSNDNTITVYNPFSTERMLYLTYATAIEYDAYPKIRVKRNGAPTVLVDPFHEEEERVTMDLARTSAVGTIPPHSTSTIQLIPIQTTATTTFPFRLIGMSLFAEEANDLVVEFPVERPETPRRKWWWWIFS